MLAAGALRDLLLVGPQTNDMLLRCQSFLHRRIDMIALPRALAPVERGEQSRCGEQARKIIRLGLGRFYRRQGWISRDIQKSAFRKSDQVIAGQVFLWTGLTKAGDRRHHNPWIDRREIFIAESFTVQIAGLKTLDDHVGVSHPLAELRAPCCSVQVENLTRFAGVEMSEYRAQAFAIGEGNEWRQISDGVAARRLDFDDFHAEIREHATAKLPGQIGQVQRSESFEKFSTHSPAFTVSVPLMSS